MKIQHKRSAALDGSVAKEPTAAQTDLGELCVNFNTADPALFIRDNADNIRRVGGDLSLYQKIEDTPPPVFVCLPDEINAQSPPAERLEGTLWWNTEEGILYVWFEDGDSEQWVIVVPQAGSDSLTEEQADIRYLSKVSDDTAAGAITFEKLTTHEAGVDVVNAVINNDGSATFAGTVTGGEYNQTSDITAGYEFTKNGILKVQRTAAEAQNSVNEVLRVFGGDTQTAAISADGSAEFAGDITLKRGESVYSTLDGTSSVDLDITVNAGRANNEGRVKFRGSRGGGALATRSLITGQGDLLIGGGLDVAAGSETPNITLSHDGSAEFASMVSGANITGKNGQDFTPWYIVGSTSSGQQRGQLVIKTSDTSIDDAAAEGGLFRGMAVANDGSESMNCKISRNGTFRNYATDGSVSTHLNAADGSAEFAGTVVVGPADITSNTANGVRILDSGSITAQRRSTQGSSTLFTGLLGDTATFQVLANGSATFAGPVEVGQYSGGVQGVKLHNGFVEATNTNASYYVFKGDLNGTETSSIKADGGASFAGLTEHAKGVKVTGGTKVPYSITKGNSGDLALRGDAENSFQVGYETADTYYQCAGSTGNVGKQYEFGYQMSVRPSTYAGTDGLVRVFYANALETYGHETRLFCTNTIASTATVSDETYGFYSTLFVNDDSSKKLYNFFAEGNAPNYFKGNIDCDGLINGAFSLRMESDDPAAFQTTYSTDEEGNQVENQTYIGTTEDLLSIIKDLRARIEQLESNTLQPLYASLADLPSASDHHGKVAHVHSEGALYFAHAGNWVKLQNA